MMNELYQLMLDMDVLNIRPSHWIIGQRVFMRLKADAPPCAIVLSLHGADRLLGLPWEIDYKNPDRLALAPKDTRFEVLESTPDADRLLRSVLGR